LLYSFYGKKKKKKKKEKEKKKKKRKKKKKEKPLSFLQNPKSILARPPSSDLLLPF